MVLGNDDIHLNDTRIGDRDRIILIFDTSCSSCMSSIFTFSFDKFTKNKLIWKYVRISMARISVASAPKYVGTYIRRRKHVPEFKWNWSSWRYNKRHLNILKKIKWMKKIIINQSCVHWNPSQPIKNSMQIKSEILFEGFLFL